MQSLAGIVGVVDREESGLTGEASLVNVGGGKRPVELNSLAERKALF